MPARILQAGIIQEVGKARLKEISALAIRPDYIRVKTIAVAVNPTDFYHTTGARLVGGILGCGFSGVVEEVGVDYPAATPFLVLIYGGSSATRTLTIQYAKFFGLTVVITASPKNVELVKSRAADAVFDYHDPEYSLKIREYTNNSIQYVFDTISTESSFKICAQALPQEPKEELNLVALLPLDA
ncbi:hypothetical protein B0J14DRAFT_565141 [Halenospora varia]|nr:hypothetical protein B0J14DRAFT_565141 [Halenospora varia]